MAVAGRLLEKGNRCLAAGLYDEARAYYQRVELFKPLAAFAKFNLGILFLHEGKKNQGILCMEEATEIDKWVGVRVGMANSRPDEVGEEVRRRLADDRADALDAIKPFGASEVESAVANEPQDEFIKALGNEDPEEQARAELARGKVLLREKKLPQARAALKRAIEIDPGEAPPYNDLAAAYLMAKDYENAIPWLEKATRLQPDYVDAFQNLGLAHLKAEQFEAAMVAYRQASTIRPESASICHQVAQCFEKMGKQDQVIAWYEKAIQADPKLGAAHYHLGCLYQKHTRFDEARESFEKAVALDKQFYKAFSNLGTFQLREGMSEGAVISFKRAIEVDPDYAAAHLNLAIAYARLKKAGEAIASLERAEALDASLINAKLCAMMGEACLEIDDASGAEKWLKRAVAIDPDFAAAGRMLGQMFQTKARDFFDAHDWDNAADWASRAVELEPDNARLHYDLGMACLKGGDLGQAITHLEKFVELDGGGADLTVSYNLACCHAIEGNVSGSLDWLERAVKSGYDEWEEARADEDLEPIKGDPRFEQLVERMKRPVAPSDD